MTIFQEHGVKSLSYEYHRTDISHVEQIIPIIMVLSGEYFQYSSMTMKKIVKQFPDIVYI